MVITSEQDSEIRLGGEKHRTERHQGVKDDRDIPNEAEYLLDQDI